MSTLNSSALNMLKTFSQSSLDDIEVLHNQFNEKLVCSDKGEWYELEDGATAPEEAHASNGYYTYMQDAWILPVSWEEAEAIEELLRA